MRNINGQYKVRSCSDHMEMEKLVSVGLVGQMPESLVVELIYIQPALDCGRLTGQHSGEGNALKEI